VSVSHDTDSTQRSLRPPADPCNKAAGSFIQTMVLTDIVTGWTECVPILLRESGLVIEALAKARALPAGPARWCGRSQGIRTFWFAETALFVGS
jgi:hypothetical protein